MSDEKRSCATCVLCLREDYGYSNWTTEGTTFHCLAGLNDALDGKEATSEWREVTPELAAVLDVALTCLRYRFGAPATMDCDHDGIKTPWGKPIPPEEVKSGGYTDDDEAAALLATRLSGERS